MADLSFQAGDGARIVYYRWLPEGDSPARAAVQIAHRMAEHATSYARFAGVLCDAGFAVYANDHRGHGRTAGALENVGYFVDADGWSRMVGDMHALSGIIRSNHPGLPLFLFGHSMGSLLSRSYMARHGDEISGVISCAAPSIEHVMALK